MMRNKSAQPSVRTPASPLCRSMMRPKVFHGTNSIPCANNVLPTFMRDSGSLNPESIANPRNQIQIVDTLKLLETILMKGLAGRIYKINRTVVLQNSAFCMQNNALINSDIIANADGATCKKKLTEA